MAVKIRLSRYGAKKRPYYRIVVADSRSPRDGRFIERLGTYDPLLSKDSENRVKLDLDRAKHWISNGAKPTDRVHRFLSDCGVLEPLVKNNPLKAKPKTKAQERKEESKKTENPESVVQSKVPESPAAEPASDTTKAESESPAAEPASDTTKAESESPAAEPAADTTKAESESPAAEPIKDTKKTDNGMSTENNIESENKKSDEKN